MADEKTLNRSDNFEESYADAETDCLQKKLADAEARLKKAHTDLLEAQADMAYVRHRAQEDLAQAHKYAIEGFARSLLAVKDNLETALRIETVNRDAFKEGITLISRQLTAAFDAFELYEICPKAGEPFDPARHRLATCVSLDRPEKTVVEVCVKGYRIGNRLLRPALVNVSLPNVNGGK